MNCPKCSKDFEPHHHRQVYCDGCRGKETESVGQPLGPLDVYSPERWSKLQGNYEFDPQIGRARCSEPGLSSNIALPSPGDPAYREAPPDELLTFADLPLQEQVAIDHEFR
jgi:hypothetical protein